jgi:hypothetical protein
MTSYETNAISSIEFLRELFPEATELHIVTTFLAANGHQAPVFDFVLNLDNDVILVSVCVLPRVQGVFFAYGRSDFAYTRDDLANQLINFCHYLLPYTAGRTDPDPSANWPKACIESYTDALENGLMNVLKYFLESSPLSVAAILAPLKAVADGDYKLRFAAEMPDIISNDQYAAYLQAVNNMMQHYLNGNGETANIQLQLNTKKRKAPVQKGGKSKKARVGQQVVLVGGRPERKFQPVARRLKARRVLQPKLNAMRGNPLAQAIARNITLPGESRLYRMKSDWSAVPTALVQTSRKIRLPWQAAQAFNPNSYLSQTNLTGSDMPIFVFADQTCNAIFFDPNILGASEIGVCNYGQGDIGTSASSSNPTINVPTANFAPVSTSYIPMPFIDFSNSTYKPHGSFLYARSQEGKPDNNGDYIWMHRGDRMSISVQNTVGIAANTVAASWMQWIPGGTVGEAYTANFALVAANVASVVTCTAPANGYYALQISNISNANIALTINGGGYIGNTQGKWCHQTMRDFNTNSGAVGALRITGCSALVTNVAPIQGRGGLITAVQTPSNVHWTSQAGLSFDTITQQADAAGQMDAATGIYGFLKPSRPTDFELKNFTDVQNGTLIRSFPPLTSDRDYLTIWIAIAPPGAGQVNTQAMELIVNVDGEYTTQDTWRELEVGTVPEAVYREALSHVETVKQFHENPLHLRDLWSKAGNFLRGVTKYTDPFGGKISSVGKIASDLGRIMV